MNGPDILAHHRNRLARKIAEREHRPDLDPLPASPWVAMSVLQKAIRRGREGFALRAAATLLIGAPDRLWRRLGGIVFEDVGLASIDALGLVTAALGGKRIRAQLGGEWSTASFLVSELACSPKSRASDDLLMIGETHPALADARREYANMHTRDLLRIATGSAPIIERGLALRFAVGNGGRATVHMPARKGEPRAAFDWLCEAGLPHSVVEIAREGHRRNGEALPPLVALLAGEEQSDALASDDPLPPETMVGGVPSWSLDTYTREGRRAFALFLRSDAPSAVWVHAHVAPRHRVQFLGGVAFRAEGGCLRRRVRTPLSDELRRTYEVECAGPECGDATEIMQLLRSDIPALNEARAEIMGSVDHA
ncbi:MAG: hypothetical protein QM651_01430 [Rhodoblastus sp.]